MIDKNRQARLILEALYNQICNCRRDYEELENLLNPKAHLEDCLYRIEVEKVDIEWNLEPKKEEQTTES